MPRSAPAEMPNADETLPSDEAAEAAGSSPCGLRDCTAAISEADSVDSCGTVEDEEAEDDKDDEALAAFAFALGTTSEGVLSGAEPCSSFCTLMKRR